MLEMTFSTNAFSASLKLSINTYTNKGTLELPLKTITSVTSVSLNNLKFDTNITHTV